MIMHKAHGGRLKLQQTMDGFGFQPCRLCQRLAARPVGAQSNTSIFLAWRIWRILVTMVVLPTPGPPVITVTLLPGPSPQHPVGRRASDRSAARPRGEPSPDQSVPRAGPLEEPQEMRSYPTSARWRGARKRHGLPSMASAIR